MEIYSQFLLALRLYTHDNWNRVFLRAVFTSRQKMLAWVNSFQLSFSIIARDGVGQLYDSSVEI